MGEAMRLSVPGGEGFVRRARPTVTKVAATLATLVGLTACASSAKQDSATGLSLTTAVTSGSEDFCDVLARSEDAIVYIGSFSGKFDYSEPKYLRSREEQDAMVDELQALIDTTPRGIESQLQQFRLAADAPTRDYLRGRLALFSSESEHVLVSISQRCPEQMQVLLDESEDASTETGRSSSASTTIPKGAVVALGDIFDDLAPASLDGWRVRKPDYLYAHASLAELPYQGLAIVTAVDAEGEPEELSGRSTTIRVRMLGGRGGGLNDDQVGRARAGDNVSFLAYGGDSVIAGRPQVGDLVRWFPRSAANEYAYGWVFYYEPVSRQQSTAFVTECCPNAAAELDRDYPTFDPYPE